ncbi:MAG: phosphoadenylyl-sulfate reductase [Bacteroidetes bacterium HGW-Bacteroidetes-17]|jgi:phosphoadenosine phosphosulfate reductase|nr:MAG: phosphoadenylyl-sulfate reductase [Bacteroidetes bacterium HGW-Bacteroidetes-17]
MNLEQIKNLNLELKNSSAVEIITYFLERFNGRIAFASSFGAEDQVILQMLSVISKEIKVFTLDTGRLFPETYELIDKSRHRYKIPIDIYFPEAREVEAMVKEKGINLFYENIENRKQCCNIRKINPLKRALEGMDVWIAGLRKEQSPTRTEMKIVEWDSLNGLIKINPLIDWTEEQIWAYIKEHNIPYNFLHDKGFLSIGCQPCTRAIQKGEDSRAGRWWWENPDTKECGLHKK